MGQRALRWSHRAASSHPLRLFDVQTNHRCDGRLAVHSVYLAGGDVSPLSESPASRQPTAPALSHGAAAAGVKGNLYAIKEACAELHVYAARHCNDHIARSGAK